MDIFFIRQTLPDLHAGLPHNLNSFAWRLTAIAHGRNGDVGMTALALAESALARGHGKEARQQAVRAQKILTENSAGWLRAGDVEQAALRMTRRQ